MDELLHHCLRELSFDGDLGCDVSRLHDFIGGFYNHNPAYKQTVDDAFYAFVWSVVVQHPTVCIGTIPSGVATEVYIAPQISAKRKAKAKGEEHVGGPTPTLNILLDAKTRPLNDLKREYGENLRIAVDQETSFAAITGSHIRSSKLSPMVYTTLQLITRGRENGISVIDLGRKSGYDQKSCFYLVKQLVELDLIVKVRRGGVGTHFCIHKYLYERNPLWQQIRDEELQADQDFEKISRKRQSESEDEHGEEDDEPSAVDFEPIDARHLSSLPLVRARVIKLLKGSKNHMHVCNNMLLTIGFSNPTKTDRRFFQSRIRELVQQGVIEKVIVPSKKKSDLHSMIKCFRLVTSEGSQEGAADGLSVQPQLVGDDDKDDGVFDDQSGIKTNLTIHRQLVDLLDEAGTMGMTLSELSTALCHFDKRTIELLLTRAERVPPPSHLNDLGIAVLMETHGRERRNRYFTIASYRTLVAQENLDQPTVSYSVVNLNEVGGFAAIAHSAFYEDETVLFKYQDEFKEQGKTRSGGKPRKYPLKNPILSDGTVKQGRPKGSTKKAKLLALGEIGVQPTTKRKRAESDNVQQGSANDGNDGPQSSRPGKKRRFKADNVAGGFPIENGAGISIGLAVDPTDSQLDFGPPDDDEVATVENTHSETRNRPPKEGPGIASGEAGQMLTPKKRGRPPKKKPNVDNETGKGDIVMAGPDKECDVSIPKKRGDPPKRKLAALQGTAAGRLVDQLKRTEENTFPPNERDRSSHKKPAALDMKFGEYQAGVSAQFLPEGQVKKRARIEIDPPELPDHHAEVDTTTSPLLLSSERTGTPRRTAGFAHISDLDVLGSNSQFERDGLGAVHDSHRLHATTCHPRDLTATLRNEPSLRSEPVWDFVEHQPGDMGHKNADSDTSPSQARPSPIPIESSASPGLRESPILPKSFYSEFHNLQRQPDTFVTIDPSLTMGETGGANTSSSEVRPLANLRAEKPLTNEVISGVLTSQPDDQTNVIIRPRVNVSNLRRENELMRVIQDLGGIVNYHTKEFVDAHAALIRTMAKSGEPTSAPPDVRIDKRTAGTTLTNLENRGRVKTLKTSLKTPTGLARPACIVYLPDIPQDKINAFLGDLSRSVTCVPQPIKVDNGSNQIQYNSLPLQLLHMDRLRDNRQEYRKSNAARANQLFSYDDLTIRNVLLTEKTTLGQLYGFIVPKARRARELHLSTINAFENGTLSPNIVSLQHRIVHLSYFYQDIALSTYCALVSPLNHTEELTQFLGTETGSQTPVRDIPHNLYNIVLQVGRARARSRILDIMEMLRSLKLVTPLQPSTSATPLITCAIHRDHPTAFDVASWEGWTVGSPALAPIYWRFNIDVPLHFWVLSETSPPFWKDVPVASRADAEVFWGELRDACMNRDYPHINADPRTDSITGPLDASSSAARSLRRAVSWNDEYILTWHQKQYLMRFVDISTGNTPLQNELNQVDQMQNICWVISAPRDVATDFFVKARAKMVRAMDRTRKKTKRPSAADKARQVNEAKALLLKKAAEAKTQREQDWEGIVLRVHAEPLKGPAAVRVRRVRSRFLQSTFVKDVQRWENEIIAATQEATMPVTTTFKRPKPAQRIATPPITVNPPEKSIETLIAQQGPPLLRHTKNKRKRTGNNEDNDPTEEVFVETANQLSLRRHRFQWNREYDELARDASAVIRARCRDGPRLDWRAVEQVFPAVPRNSVRQRLAHIRETPGNEAYLNRLEDRWYELWLQHRGTALLPDGDPQSLSNFSLIKHIEFLRMHVDKNALRVGFGQPNEKAGTNLPASVDNLLKDWDILESLPVAPEFEFMWSAAVDEGREKSLLRRAITTNMDDLSRTAYSSSELEYVAEAAVKMTFGTPYESYSTDAAARLLHGLGEQVVSTAAATLVNRGVLSKTVRDPHKSKPGRTLKISELNQNAIGGSISRDTFQDAATLEDISSQQQGSWREWPLLATEGDMCTLLQLISDCKVEFKIDTSQPQNARASLDWNSKKTDDDQIETSIFVQFRDLSAPAHPFRAESLPALAVVELDDESSLDHGKSVDGGIACCRKQSDGLVNCQACIEAEHSNFAAKLDEEDRELSLDILTIIHAAGSRGVIKSELLTNTGAPSEAIHSLVRRMMDAAVPLMFWTGYASVVLVSSLYLQEWTVTTSESPKILIFPRRWFDIVGLKMNDVWESALKAVVGVILFRPGISQAELRWRLRSVYDRQEIHDILCHLWQERFIKSRRDPRIQPIAQDDTTMIVLDDWEEETTFWFIGEGRHWYQI